MGDPRKQKKKYVKPSHPWQASRIEEERELIKQYALKNKKEIWKAVSKIRSFKRQAKKIIASQSEQSKTEGKQLLQKLDKLSIIQKNSKIEDVLDINIQAILDRRLQTQVFGKGLARTQSQARQFITHGHIAINNSKVNVPSYLVSSQEESSISFIPKSPLRREDHPERITQKKEKSKIVKPKKKETDRAEKPKDIKKEKVESEEKREPKEVSKKNEEIKEKELKTEEVKSEK